MTLTLNIPWFFGNLFSGTRIRRNQKIIQHMAQTRPIGLRWMYNSVYFFRSLLFRRGPIYAKGWFALWNHRIGKELVDEFFVYAWHTWHNAKCYISHVTLKNWTVIQSEKNLALIFTFLMITVMQHASQKLIKLVDLSHVRGAVIWNTVP